MKNQRSQAYKKISYLTYDMPIQWRWSAAARLLGLWGRIPPEAWMSLVSVVCCQVEVSATGRLHVQRNPTDCGLSECDREISKMVRSRPTMAVEPGEKRL